MTADFVIKHVVARGRVQGVGFRAFVVQQALARQVAGWVRNRRDGTVEAVFAGDSTAVRSVVAACQAGPRHAQVDVLDQRDGTEVELAERGSGTFVCLPTV